MPGCAAVNCSNSSQKGFLMKRFPRDPLRRKQWSIKVKRDNWIPTDHSYLCEAHFSPEMWEKTPEDGSRKLKIDAVPTIFSFSKPKKVRKPPPQRKMLTPKKVMPSIDELNITSHGHIEVQPRVQPCVSASPYFPKLSEEDLCPSHFSKIKVSTSTNVISHTVSSPLAEVSKKPEYLTTAWFLDQVEKWFYYMTSRHPSCAFSKFNLDAYNKSISFLEDFMDIFLNMEVGYKRLWKPSQTGVLISSQSMLELQKYLLDIKEYKFVLTSRFSHDCLENLFCVLRSKQIVPNAVQVKNNLKVVCVSQYLKNISNSSYEEDEREFLSGFLDTLKEPKSTYDEIQLPSEIKEPIII